MDKVADNWFVILMGFLLLMPLCAVGAEIINNLKLEPSTASQTACQKDKLISVGTVKVNGILHAVCLNPSTPQTALLVQE